MEGTSSVGSRLAVVADVGRTAIRVGLTDGAGRLRPDTVRAYGPAEQPTVSGALGGFARELGLPGLPPRLAVAVSGATRGNSITVTNGRWIVSRQGLAAMIQAPPLILNDFAANAWAIGAADASGRLEALVGDVARPREPGTYCIIGIGSGLGVALLTRDGHGSVTVTPSEAGHCAFPSGLAEAGPVVASLGAHDGFATAETLISGPGLLAIYGAVAKLRGAKPVAADPKDVIRLGANAREPVAAEALSLFGKVLWHFAANMTLAYGAWDGVILTGGVAGAMRDVLKRPDLAQRFLLNGPYRRQLATVPRSIASFRHAELEGAAAALLVEDARRAFGERALAA